MDKLTQEQIQAKADELKQKHGVNIMPLVFEDPDDSTLQIVGYIKEPARMVKLRVLDKAMTSPVTAAAELLEAVLIKEESDPRIYSEKPEDDKYNLGAVMACYQTVTISMNTFKKK